MSQAPDSKPGFYYVTVIYNGMHYPLLGPFHNDHAGALAMVDAVRAKAVEIEPRLWFDAFGTSRTEKSQGPGKLNSFFPCNDK